MRGLRSVLVLAVVAGLISAGPTALAAWNKTSDGNGRTRAISMPSGNTPWTSVSNRNVTVSWSAVTMPGGIPVDGYRVYRYNGSTSVPVTGSCVGVVSNLTCSETAMAPGSWRYAVAPVYKLWQGAQGPQSAAANVAAPQLNLTGSTTLTSLPGNLTGNVAHFITGQTVTLRLDNPTSGQVVTGNFTPNSIPASGSANVTGITIPAGVTNGTHTLYAIGSQGDVASATFSVNVPILTPTLLQLINGGSQTGRIQEDDIVQITYSQPLKVSSVCAGAPDDNQPVSAPGYVRITNNNGTSGHDLLTVDTPLCPGGLNFGSISLGSSGFVTSTQQFEATISYTPANRRVTVVLGPRTTGGSQPPRVTQSVTATYTPDPAMTAVNGQLITGTVSSTGVQF
jgi:hypothetical protein